MILALTGKCAFASLFLLGGLMSWDDISGMKAMNRIIVRRA
jgi:hypothetical protein